MSTKSQIVISTASVAAALQAVSGAVSEHKNVVVPETVGFEDAAREGLGTSQAQDLLRQARPALVRGISLDGKTLSERYIEVAEDDYMDSLGGTSPTPTSGSIPSSTTKENIEYLKLVYGVSDPAEPLMIAYGVTKAEAEAYAASVYGTTPPAPTTTTGYDTGSRVDSTMTGGGYTYTCYTNCHSACHGSRGWR